MPMHHIALSSRIKLIVSIYTMYSEFCLEISVATEHNLKVTKLVHLLRAIS